MGKKETLIGLEKFNDLSFDINSKAIEGEGTFTEPDNRIIKYDGDVEDFNELGQVFRSENIDKKLAANQSGWEQLGAFAVQSVGEIVGGTISGVGAIGGAFQAAYAEYKDEDATFNNAMIQLGEDIKQGSKDLAPIYRENAGKSWDLKDSGWWFENAVSFASTASMLIPSYGAVKGLGYLGKLLKLTDKVGDTTKYLAKIATGAVVSRNAENFTESLQVVNNVKADLSKRFENEEEFQKIANSAVGQELAAEGREVTKESLTNFIASKAGWKSYQVNSINVIFDAIQMSAAFKNPMTRKGLFGASSAEKAAEKALLSGETAVKQSFTGRLGDIGKTIARTTYLQSSEGVEEGINYMGTLVGENLAKELTGEKAEDINWGQLTESAFWGALGGIANTAGAGAYKAATGTPSGKAQRDASVNEIKNRLNFIQESSDKIKSIVADKSLNDEQKKVQIAQEKQQSIAHMTFNAAANQNVDGVLSMINNPTFKDKLVQNGFETTENVDKAIAKINTEVLQAEKHYKDFANNFQTQNIDGQLKASLIFQGANIAFFNDKFRERQNTVANELTELKNNDAFFDETSSPNLENTVQLAALKYANQNMQAYKAKEKDEKVANLIQERINENTKQIETLEEAFKNTEKADISRINPKITEKQVESILLGNEIKTNGQFINEQVLNKDRVKEREAELVQKRKDEVLKKENEFKANVEKDLAEGKTNVQELKNLKTTANKSLHPFLDEKIKQLELTQKAAQDTAVVQNAKNPDPVNNSEDWKKDKILSNFADDLEQQTKLDVNEENLSPALKEEIDNYLAEKSFNFSLMETLYLVKKPSTKDVRQYLINKLLERKENFGKTQNEAIKEANIVPVESSTELEFNEDTYSELQGNKPVTIDKKADIEEDKFNREFSQIIDQLNNFFTNTLGLSIKFDGSGRRKLDNGKEVVTYEITIYQNGKAIGNTGFKIVNGKIEISLTEINEKLQGKGVASVLYQDINNALQQLGYGVLHSDTTFLEDSRKQETFLIVDGKELSLDETSEFLLSLEDPLEDLEKLKEEGRVQEIKKIKPGEKLWQSLERKGLAEKLENGQYRFINAKYDAELAALENTKPVSDKKADIERRRQEDLKQSSIIPITNYLYGNSPKEALVNFREYFKKVLAWEHFIVGYNKPSINLDFGKGDVLVTASVQQLAGGSSFINVEVNDVINAKYDAEIAALETQVDLDEDAGIEYSIEKEVNPTNTLIGIGAFHILNKDNFEQVKNGVKLKKLSKSFKALQKLRAGDKLIVSVDTKNRDYEANKNDIHNVPLKVTTEDGTFITWISRTDKVPAKFISEKDEVIKLRKAIAGNATITVTVTQKSDGSVVNTPTWQSIDKVGLGDSKFYAIKPNSGDNYLSSLNSIATGKADTFITTRRQGGFGVISKFSELQVARDIQLGKTINREGTVYILLEGMDGKIIPSPVVPSKLNRSQAVGLEKTLVSLVKELGKSEAINRQEINDLIDKVKDLINVDRRSEGQYQDETAKSFRYYAKKGDKQARLELVYRVVGEQDFGKKRTLVIRENGIQIYQEEPTGQKDENGKKLYKKELITRNGKSLFPFDTKGKGTTETLLSKVLEAKHYNLDFTRLGTDEAYTKKTIEGGHILTNVGQVFDEDGEPMGNFIGESNSFKLMINTNLNEYGVNNEEWSKLSEEVKKEIIAQKNNC